MHSEEGTVATPHLHLAPEEAMSPIRQGPQEGIAMTYQI